MLSRTVFEILRVIRSRPFQGWFVIRGLGLAAINLPTKCEVSISAHYVDMKKDTKCGKCGGLRQLGVTQVHWKLRHSVDRIYEFLLVLYSNYVPILHRFWDIARYWLKIANLNPPYLYLSPLLAVAPLEFWQDLWHQKTGVLGGLSYGVVSAVVCVILYR